MTVTQTQISAEFQGSGVQTVFAIPFELRSAEQIRVSRLTISTGTSANLVEGTDYILSGPTGFILPTTVNFLVAPTTDHQITIYRTTEFLQDTEFVDTGPFPAESLEDQLDLLVMMLQELSARVTLVTAPASGTGFFYDLGSQELSSAETLTIDGRSDPRLIKKIYGAQVEAAVTTIATGLVPWQELILIGTSDALTVRLTEAGNLDLNGELSVGDGTTLTLVWDNTTSKWRETARRN